MTTHDVPAEFYDGRGVTANLMSWLLRGAMPLAVALLVSMLAAPGAQAGEIHYVPASIDATCVTDVTSQIQAVIDATPNGGMTSSGPAYNTVSFPPGGCYRIEGTLRLVNRAFLRIDGNGSIFRAFDSNGTFCVPAEGGSIVGFVCDWRSIRTRAHFRSVDSTYLHFTDLEVWGANPYAGQGDLAYNSYYEAQHGFDILGASSRVRVDFVKVHDVWGDFVYVGGPNVRGRPSDVTVADNVFERNGRQGVAVAAGDRILIERNVLDQTRRATFDIEPTKSTWAISHVTIRDNWIGPGRLLFLAMHGAAAPITDVLVERNTLVGQQLSGSVNNPSTVRGLRARITIRDNTSDAGQPGNLIGFTRADDVTVTGNHARTTTSRPGYLVRFNDVCGTNDVSGNTLVNGLGELVITYPCSVV